jgi:hypothetical protein
MLIDARRLLRRLNRCPDCGRLPAVSRKGGVWRLYCPDCDRHRYKTHATLGAAITFWNSSEEWATEFAGDEDDNIPFYGELDESDEESLDGLKTDINGKVIL